MEIITSTRVRMLAAACAITTLAACRTTVNEVATAADEAVFGYSTRNTLIIGALGAAAFYVIDPLAPNWEVSRHQVNDTRYSIDLRMKRFHTGGEGEAEPLFSRHAAEMAAELGAGEYRLLSYTEGIDSNVAVPQRWARGVIELLPAPPRHTAKR